MTASMYILLSRSTREAISITDTISGQKQEYDILDLATVNIGQLSINHLSFSKMMGDWR